MNIAIITGAFPAMSETFVINHVTSLIELGEKVDFFAFEKSSETILHETVKKYNLNEKITYVYIPEKRKERLKFALKILAKNFIFHPLRIFQCFNFKETGCFYYSLNRLFILSYFLRKNYQIIHCHFGTNAKKIIFLKDSFPKTKFIVTFHGYDIRLGLKENGYYSELAKKFDRFISICKFNSEKLIEIGFPYEKIINLSNGINLDKFKRVGTKKEVGKFIITTVARLVEEKNIFFALEVINLLKKLGFQNLEYHLVGDGNLRVKIKERVASLELAQFTKMYGALSDDEVIGVLQSTDIFFLPSKAEAFPTVLLEAQAMGIPVVATDVGGVKEAFNDKITGYLIPNGDVSKAVKRMTELISDRKLLNVMGKASRRFVEENFDIHKLNYRLVEIYQGVLNNAIR